MARLGKRERAALDAVARQFGGGWEDGSGSPAAWLDAGGRRIAAEVVALSGPAKAATPRLRFDKVVLRLVSGLRDTLSDAVPDGQAVIVTVTAPIRLPGRTEEALAATLRDRLARRPSQLEIEGEIHGNRVRVRLVTGAPPGAARLVGFVHNPDPGAAETLLHIAQVLLQAAAVEPVRHGFKGERWLVLAADEGAPGIATVRQVHAELGATGGVAKILLARPRGTVETVAG